MMLTIIIELVYLVIAGVILYLLLNSDVFNTNKECNTVKQLKKQNRRLKQANRDLKKDNNKLKQQLKKEGNSDEYS